MYMYCRTTLVEFHSLLFSKFFSAHCASFSAASRQYTCGFADSSLHLWSLSPGATTSLNPSHMTESRTSHSAPDHKVLLGHHGPVYGTCFSSNGQFLLSTSEDCTVRLWNVQRRSSVVSYRGHAYPVWDTAFRLAYYRILGIHNWCCDFLWMCISVCTVLWMCILLLPHMIERLDSGQLILSTLSGYSLDTLQQLMYVWLNYSVIE